MIRVNYSIRLVVVFSRRRVGGLQSDRLEFKTDFDTFQKQRVQRWAQKNVFRLANHGPASVEEEENEVVEPAPKRQKVGIGLKIMLGFGKKLKMGLAC